MSFLPAIHIYNHVFAISVKIAPHFWTYLPYFLHWFLPDLPKPWVFCLSFLVSFHNFEFLEIFRGSEEFCFQICLFQLWFISITMHLLFQSNWASFLAIFALFSALIFTTFAQTLSFVLEFWVFSLSFEFFNPWVFLARSKKRAWHRYEW